MARDRGLHLHSPYRGPLHAYGHGVSPTTGCALTGGAFYNPATPQFPSEYNGKYFFSDYCSGWIRRYDPASNTATGFATDITSAVDLKVGLDGSLYYLARDAGAVYRILSSNQAPQIATHPASQTVSSGQPVTFNVTASGSVPLSYQWQRNGSAVPGATASSYTLASTAPADNGALFRCVVTNAYGSATSNNATLTVTFNTPPTATIVTPVAGARYTAGPAYQLLRHGRGCTEREPGGRRFRLAHRPPPRHAHASRRPALQRRYRRLLHPAHQRRDLRQRLVPHPFNRSGIPAASPIPRTVTSFPARPRFASPPVPPACSLRWAASR